MQQRTMPVLSSSDTTQKKPRVTIAKRKKIFILAGEPSGDILAARLIQNLKNLTAIELSGVGGDALEKEGLKSLFPMEDLAVMGVAEVLPRLRNLLKRIDETVEAVGTSGAEALITVDSQDFSYRVARKVKSKYPHVKCIHYVAPTVWAWRPGRAKKIARFLDYLLTLYPFEPPYFLKHGLSCDFVGHPVLESGVNRGNATSFRLKYNIDPDLPVLCMLPGSRQSELKRLLPVFVRTAERFISHSKAVQIVVPTLPHLKKSVSEAFLPLKKNVIILDNQDEKYDAFAASRVALAASGTVTLELALAGVPHVVAYRVSPLTAFLGRFVIKTPFANLINIILKEPVVPEILQKDCTAERLGREVLVLLDSAAQRAQQIEAFDRATQFLKNPDGTVPSKKAAQNILKVIEAGG